MGIAHKGLAKLSEEIGELQTELGKLQQVIGKAIQVGSIDNMHWSGSLREKLEEEMADVLASIRYVRDRNSLDADKIDVRADKKYRKFAGWETE